MSFYYITRNYSAPTQTNTDVNSTSLRDVAKSRLDCLLLVSLLDIRGLHIGLQVAGMSGDFTSCFELEIPGSSSN